MKIRQLIRELKALKERGVNDAYIDDIKELLIDYWNETQDRTLDEYINTFANDEDVSNAVAYRAGKWDRQQAKYIVEDLTSADYYKDDGDYFSNIEDGDVEDRLDEIISNAKDLLPKKKKDGGTK